MKPRKGKFKKVPTTYDLDAFLAAKPEKAPAILLADIETSLMLVQVFSTFKPLVGVEDIVQDWNILSFAAKWHGTGPILYQSLRYQPKPVNDFNLCKALHRILSVTDVVIAHNGKRFDLRKIRARMALNRMPPIPNVRVIDTLLESRKQFGFTSHKLIYLSERFGPDGMRKVDHGKYPGKALWRECQKGNQDAWTEMELYNVPDVLALEGVYDEMRPWYQGAQNLGIYQDPAEREGQHSCPNCGSGNTQRRGIVYTQVNQYQRYRCMSCGAWSRGTVRLLSRMERAHVNVN